MDKGSLQPQGAASVPTDLVERLSAATAGSRELDAEIWCLFVPGGARVDVDRHMFVYPDKSFVPVAIAPAYTTSLDAALALAERLGMGAAYTLDAACQTTHKSQPTAHLWNDTGKHTGHARTMPLALCIAILKARTAVDGPSPGIRE